MRQPRDVASLALRLHPLSRRTHLPLPHHSRTPMSALDNIQEIRKKSITVGFLADECRDRFQLRPLNAGVGRGKLITDRNLHRPQLALTGYTKLFTYHRVQVLGNTEFFYLQSLSP